MKPPEVHFQVPESPRSHWRGRISSLCAARQDDGLQLTPLPMCVTCWRCVRLLPLLGIGVEGQA